MNTSLSRMKLWRRSLARIVTICALLGATASWAESSQIKLNRINYELPRIEQAPVLDGELDESMWQQAIQVELKYENNPGDGIPAPVKTIAYVYEDGENMHVAFRAFDPEPNKIRAYLRDRDTLWNDDNVGIIVDTFNDQRSGFEFFVNPLGAQADMTMTDTGGWREDSSWDAIWDSFGKIDEQGFVVEMTIPFRALRFPQTGEKQTWNIAFWRNYPRDIRHQMSNYKPNRDSECNLCLFEQITGFENIKQGENIQLTPTLTTIRSDEKEVDESEWTQGSVDAEAGLDLRWGITQDMVLNATINPDFSQVEADSAQLDINNTFSLFFPERRPFFLDGASYFKTERFNFVHTRNIADPDYGVKITGKTNQHSYGLMVANDNKTAFLLPEDQGSSVATLTEEIDGEDIDIGSDIAIARYKMDVGERNNIGVMVTNRRGDDYDNTLASVDGRYWLDTDSNISYQLAYADTQNPLLLQQDEELPAQQADHAGYIGYNHNTRDYGVRAAYYNVGADFRADLGFMSQVGYEKLVIGGDQTWYGEEGDLLTRWGYFGDWDKTLDVDGNVLEEEFEIHANIQGPLQFYTNFGVVSRDKFYDGVMYKEQFGMFWFGFNPASGVRLEFNGRHGDSIDYANGQLGEATSWGSYMNVQLGTHVQVRGSFEHNQMEVTGGTLYTAQQSDIRLTYQFDMRSYVRLVVQYTDIDKDQSLYEDGFDPEDGVEANSRYLSTQLLYSYKINPQTLFFVGFSDSGMQDDDLTKITRTDRTVFAKFSYAWQM